MNDMSKIAGRGTLSLNRLVCKESIRFAFKIPVLWILTKRGKTLFCTVSTKTGLELGICNINS